MSNIHNIVFDQGDTFEQVISLRTGVAPDVIVLELAGSGFRGEVRKAYDSPEAAATFSFIVDEVNNTVTAVLSAEVTAGMAPGIYVYDIEWVNAAGSVKKILKGRVRVGPEVTKI
jgi:hypothetical protein